MSRGSLRVLVAFLAVTPLAVDERAAAAYLESRALTSEKLGKMVRESQESF